jgi:hypothetical protein
MLGAIILAVILVVAIPVSVIMSGALLSAVLGWSLRDNGEATHPGSELIELS